MVHHDGCGVLDATDEIVFAVPIKSLHLSHALQATPLSFKIIVEKIGNHDAMHTLLLEVQRLGSPWRLKFESYLLPANCLPPTF